MRRPAPLPGPTDRRSPQRGGRRRRNLALALALALSWIGAAEVARAQKAPDPVPADFKLAIAFFGVGKEPITTAELVVNRGIAYLFASESREEIVIFDPAAARLEFLDLSRKIQAEVMLAKLDTMQAMLHRSIAAEIGKREAEGGRANRLAAEMSRALINPGLAETFDPDAHHVRLTNPNVTVDARGEPEPDPARLALIDAALTALIKLASARDPKAIPPFIRLEALHALTVGHHLRPAELSFLYRLAGPPRRHRWTYRLVEGLTAREHEALNRVTRLRETAPYIPFNRYELHEAANKQGKHREETGTVGGNSREIAANFDRFLLSLFTCLYACVLRIFVAKPGPSLRGIGRE